MGSAGECAEGVVGISREILLFFNCNYMSVVYDMPSQLLFVVPHMTSLPIMIS